MSGHNEITRSTKLCFRAIVNQILVIVSTVFANAKSTTSHDLQVTQVQDNTKDHTHHMV